MKKTFQVLIFSDKKIHFLLSLMLSTGCIFLLFSGITNTELLRIYFNSDMLYDPVIFKDIFLDHSGFEGWHLNAAPNFFPDMFFYFIFYAISGDFIIANFLFSSFQYLSILLLVFFLFLQSNRNKAWQFATLFNYLMFLLLLLPVITGRARLTFPLISISYHMGAFVMFLLSINLLVWYLKSEKKTPLLLLLLSVVIGTINDRLYISQFVLSVVPLAFLFYNKVYRRKLLLPIPGIIGGTIFGLILFRILRVSGVIHIIGTGSKMMNFENISSSWQVFWNYIASLFSKYGFEKIIFSIYMISILLSILFTIKFWKRIFLPEKQEEFNIENILFLIIFIYLPLTLLTPILNGAFISPSLIRYNIMSLYMGFMLLPFLLMIWPGIQEKLTGILKYLLPFTALSFIVIFSIMLSSKDFKKGWTAYFTYYPEQTAVIDKLKDEYHLKYGVGNYWYAKYNTMFSKNDARIYTIFEEALRPFYHSTNENWYHSGGKGKYKDPVFNFMVRSTKAKSEKLLTTFGDNIDTLYVDNTKSYLILKLPDFIIERETREFKLLETDD